MLVLDADTLGRELIQKRAEEANRDGSTVEQRLTPSTLKRHEQSIAMAEDGYAGRVTTPQQVRLMRMVAVETAKAESESKVAAIQLEHAQALTQLHLMESRLADQQKALLAEREEKERIRRERKEESKRLQEKLARSTKALTREQSMRRKEIERLR